MIKQFLPGEFCLNKCRCCCRFSQRDSVWSPCVLNEEIPRLLKENIPAAVISKHKKLQLKSPPAQNNDKLPAHIGPLFICPFLNPKDSKCKIYAFRPFECQLYPFLVNSRGKKFFLSVDLGCPFVKENLNSKEFKEYVSYLADFLNSPSQIDRLRNNPQIIQAYPDACDFMELKI